jgi:hypothetical protein
MKSDTPDHDEAERLDRELTRACQRGENQCMKQPMDYWSINIHELKRDLSVWCQFKSRRQRGRSSGAFITRANNVGIPLVESMSLKTIEIEIQKIGLAVKMIHKEHATRRDAWLLEMSNIAEDEDHKTKAKGIRQMRKAERTVRVCRKLRFERGKLHNGGGISRL